MTDPMTLPHRIEAAEGADRALDYDIAHLTGDHFRNGGKAPAYTASIDAALTLVDAETDPLDILEQAIASCRDARDGIVYLPLHICPIALRAKEISDGE